MRAILVGVLFLSFAVLAGCQHTVEGFGQDMQHNGKEIQNSVQGNK